MTQPSSTALLARAFSLHQAGRLTDAAAAYQEALRSQPHNRAALNNLGALQIQAGDYAAAVATFGTLVAQRPDDAIARCNFGYSLIQLDRASEAELHLRRAISLRPDYAQAHNNLGIALAQLNRFEEAAAAFAHALELEPAYADAANNLGDCLNRTGEGEHAAAVFEARLNEDPNDRRAGVGLALAHALQGRLRQAQEALEQLAEAHPDDAQVWRTLGLAHYWDAQLMSAETAFRKALTLQPDSSEASFGAAASLLGRGEFAAGWPLYEQRPEGSLGASLRFPHIPRWDGRPLPGMLLLYGEQGLGDVTQFCRYVPLVKERVGGIALLLDQHWQALAPLLESLPGIDALLTDVESLGGSGAPPVMACASILSLPYLFNTTPTTIPRDIPYLRAPPTSRRAWSEMLRSVPTLRVGIAWAVYARVEQLNVTRHKSVPFELLAPLFDIPGVSLVSLQKDPAGKAVRDTVAAGKLIDYSAEFHDFGETAALIENLDLVITTDTSVAHVAGALGKPVWMLDRFNTCWRWRLSTIDTPWYPTMRIFRQTQFGDWKAVVDQVAIELRRYVAANS